MDHEIHEPLLVPVFTYQGVGAEETERYLKSGVKNLFLTSKIVHPIEFPNEVSEARDLCANERNYLSSLRTSVYLALAGFLLLANVAFPDTGTSTIKSHELFKKAMIPLGIVFSSLSIIGILTTIYNYAQVVSGYARQESMVTSWPLYILIALSASAALITNLFLLL